MHQYSSLDDDALCALALAVGEDRVLLAEPMAGHTTFGIGGPADVLVVPPSIESCVKALDILGLAAIDTLTVGNGSNLLVGDQGIRGAVVLLRENLSRITCEGTRVHAEAGALLGDVAAAAAAEGLTGLEAISGIPATVGGACFMNAGAYDHSTGDVLESVTVYVPGAREGGDGGAVAKLGRDELGFGYRHSRVSSEGLIVLAATFRLERGDAHAIRAAMEDYRVRRASRQPLELPSAGSTFKRPAGHFAGRLIMEAGLRGLSVGGAQVSEKHCGFVVNADHASAADVCALIARVQAEVKRQFAIELEKEIRRVGEF